MEKEKFSAEMLEKAKTAQSPEELRSLAREAGLELTDQQAAAYFERLQPPVGEISDEELDNVAGGGCRDDSIRIACPSCGSVSCNFRCSINKHLSTYKCRNCGRYFNAYS